MAQSKSQSIPITVANWSGASQRSAGYCPPSFEYKDRHYQCYRCRRPSVFSATAQREAFEVRKVYIWQQRILCEECFVIRRKLEHEVKEFNRRWCTEQSLLKKDLEALKHWSYLLEELPYYGIRRNTAQLTMLKRLITDSV